MAISVAFGQVDANKNFLTQGSAMVYSEATGQMTRTVTRDIVSQNSFFFSIRAAYVLVVEALVAVTLLAEALGVSACSALQPMCLHGDCQSCLKGN